LFPGKSVKQVGAPPFANAALKQLAETSLFSAELSTSSAKFDGAVWSPGTNLQRRRAASAQ